MYALNLDKETGRILSATFEKYAAAGMPVVEALPEGDITDYLFKNREYIYRPVPVPPPEPAEPTQLDRVQAQADYTAMMTDTLLEV